MAPEPVLTFEKRRKGWYWTLKVSSLYSPNPWHGLFESRDEAAENAAERQARFA